MREGLLWFDNDPNRQLNDKVKQAAARYKNKLHRKPTVCYMNADEFDSKISKVGGIDLKPANHILPHHYWVGVEQDTVLG